MNEKLTCKHFKYVALSLIAFYLFHSTSVYNNPELSVPFTSKILFDISNVTYLASQEYANHINSRDTYKFDYNPLRYCYFSGNFQSTIFKFLRPDGYHWFNANDPKHCAWRHRLFRKNNMKKNPIHPLYDSEIVTKINYDAMLYKRDYQKSIIDEEKTANTILSISKPKNKAVLCLILKKYYCESQYIAESIDLIYIVIPIYGIDQEANKDLYILHDYFKYHMKSIGIPCIVVEAIYPGQDYKVSEPNKENQYIQLEISESFYYRENLVNVAARKNKNWEYLTWIDGHQIFLNPFWWEEAIYKMEKYAAVQLFSEINHFTECNNSFYQNAYSFQALKLHRKNMATFPDMYGNAWGIRREIYDQIDHIIDECVASGCDTAWNYATFEDENDWNHWTYYPFYLNQLTPWINQARKVLGGKTHIVRGELVHVFHDHFYEYEYYLSCLSMGGYNLSSDVYRDENFMLHLKSETLTWIFERDE